MSTVRAFVDMHVTTANNLPAGLDSELELAVCDGDSMTVVPRVDVSDCAELDRDTGAALRMYILVRGHLHPGDNPKTVRAEIADVDNELRRLLDEPPIPNS